MEGIIRPATEDEKKNFTDLTSIKKSSFEQQLTDREQTAINTHSPFCARCARIDYNDKMQTALKELERVSGNADVSKLDSTIKINLDEYSKPDRFKLIAESPITENKLIDGVRVPFKTGYFMKYQCQKRGCGISVYIPVEEYEKRKSSKVVSTDKKI